MCIISCQDESDGSSIELLRAVFTTLISIFISLTISNPFSGEFGTALISNAWNPPLPASKFIFHLYPSSYLYPYPYLYPSQHTCLYSTWSEETQILMILASIVHIHTQILKLFCISVTTYLYPYPHICINIHSCIQIHIQPWSELGVESGETRAPC